MKVRPVKLQCKPRRRAPLLLAAVSLLSALGCAAPRPTVTVALADLTRATPLAPQDVRRARVADFGALGRAYVPLSPRVGLVTVRSSQEWEALRAAAPDVGPCPDLTDAAAVGLVVRSGSAVDRQWPVRIARVRVLRGGGLVEAEYHAGSYLPDGTAYVEVTRVPGLQAVLVVDVDGEQYCP